MLKKLFQRLAQLFPGDDYHSRLERYIITRHPQTAADIEHLQRQYHLEQQRQGVV